MESFVQLIPPNSKRQLEQIERNDSALWANLKTNAQRATGMFIYNENTLLPIEEKANGPFQEQILAKKKLYTPIYLDQLKSCLLELVSVSRKADRAESTRYMTAALNALCNVASLQVTMREAYARIHTKETFDEEGMKMKNVEFLPQLVGRATVILTFQLKGKAVPVEVKLIVDGINYPLAAGNFIDLCLKGVYTKTPVSIEQLDFGRKDELVTLSVLGRREKTEKGTERDYWDPRTNQRRNIPLEVRREDQDTHNRTTVTGGAQNSAIFTPSAKPVQAFSTFGAIGMWHRKGDQNGASTTIFSAKLDRISTRATAMDQTPLLKTLDNRFSLFAYAVDGIEILDSLREGDMLVSAIVEDGPWGLLKPSDLPSVPPL